MVGVGAKTYVFIGTTLPMTAPPANQLLTVSETHFDTAFSATAPQNGHDVGIVILKDPTTITPVPYNRTALPQSLVNQPARLVGYGITSGTDTQGTSAGTRRQAPTILTSFDSMLLNFQDMQHNICEGDSGGPAFMTINGKEVIVGVTSFGIDKCPLTQPGTDTRVDAYAAFIDGFVLMFDPPTHGAGDTCSADSDCYPRSCEQTSAGQICAQSCDPAAMPDACPTGTQCTSVDGQNLCLKPGSGGSGGGDKGGGGCDVGGGLPGGAGLGLMLLALVVLWTARRARS